MPGADFLQLDATTAPRRGVTEWLVTAVRTAVLDGRLTDGTRLPPSRTLAADLGISRGCVVEAYARLTEEGLVASRTRAGTAVRSPAAERPAPAAPVANRLPAQPGPPGPEVRFDLYPGLPDLADFPRAVWLRHERTVLEQTPAAQLGYGDPRGHPELRRQLAGWLARTRAVRADPDGILVVPGVAGAIALLAQHLVDRGDPLIAVEDPGSAGAVDELRHWGMRYRPAGVDADGILVDAVRATGASSVLVTPAHQFPSGVALSADRRGELVRWAAGGRLIIEDDYDGDQRYDRAPIGAVQALAPQSVAYTGSTSKSLAPGMRLGWLVPPTGMYRDLVDRRRSSDLGSPAIAQLVLARLIASGDYDRHLRRQRARQRRRRDALVTALLDALPGLQIGGVSAGLHVQVTFPWLAGSDDREMAAEIARAGVRLQPLSWHRHAPGDPGLVIGYGVESPAALVQAAALIAQVVRRRA